MTSETLTTRNISLNKSAVEQIVRRVVLEYVRQDQDQCSSMFRNDEHQVCADPSDDSAGSQNDSAHTEHRAPGNPCLFSTPETETIKAEICAVGQKLWARQYVDGNGGNISCRIGPNEVICTPTMLSKADLTPDALCMVDLDGNQIAGKCSRTSEILLHLEIYKTVPEAKAAVHCHPPHATAYAITGRVPPSRLIPEYEVFIGQVALAPYETPGTLQFAQTVVPFVRKHNTVLLSNHGIVCWADSVTHAEWYAEVVDTYCWTLMLASQLNAPISYIPEEKIKDLLAIKKKIGLPDPRFDAPAYSAPEHSIAELDLEPLVSTVTEAVLAALNRR